MQIIENLKSKQSLIYPLVIIKDMVNVMNQLPDQPNQEGMNTHLRSKR